MLSMQQNYRKQARAKTELEIIDLANCYGELTIRQALCAVLGYRYKQGQWLLKSQSLQSSEE